MKFPIRHLTCMAALLLGAFLPAAAIAQDNRNGIYASVSGMFVMPANVPGSVTNSGVTASKLRMGSGFGVTAAVGYGAATGLRTEVELGWRSIPYNKVNIRFGNIAFDDVSVGGKVSMVTVMANGIYAFDAWKVRPYVGAGIGMAFLNSTITSIGNISVGKVSTRSSEIAYQALAGVAYPVSETAEVRVGYRYATASDYGSHNIEAGIRFRF